MMKRLSFALSLALLPFPVLAAPANVDFTVAMSEAVTVSGCPATCPRIAVDVGGQTRYAQYSAGSGSSSLTFSYAPTIGDLDLDGVTLSSPVDLNGGTMTDLNGNPITNLTFTVPNTTGIKINYPSLSMDFTNGASGRYTLNGTAYTDFSSFLGAASGTFTRATTATYYDSTGTLQTAATNTPRFDHDPITLTPKGILIEGANTNYVLNSGFSGLSGGVYTTGQSFSGWRLEVPGALTSQSITITPGVSNGIPYLDIRMQATNPAGSTQYATFATPPADYLSVTNGTKTVAQAWFGVSSYSSIGGACAVVFQNRSMTSGNAYISSTDTGTTSILPYQRRITNTLTHGATAGKASWLSFVSFPSGATCDITYRIGAPQIEVSDLATSYIPTTTAPASRAQDIFSTPTGSWYNQSSGSFFNDVSWETYAGTNYPMFFRVDDTTNNNRWNNFFRQSSSQVGVDAYTGSAGQGSWLFNSSLNGSMKIASSQKLNSSNAAFGGTLQVAKTSWIPPSVTRLHIVGGAGRKWFKTIQYYPVYVADAQLQLLTQ